MTEYRITKESRGKAKQVFRKVYADPNSFGSDAFDAALDALCVPVEEWKSQWHSREFCIGQYIVTNHALYAQNGRELIVSKPLRLKGCDPSLTKAWADAEIAKYEAEANVSEPDIKKLRSYLEWAQEAIDRLRCVINGPEGPGTYTPIDLCSNCAVLKPGGIIKLTKDRKCVECGAQFDKE